MPYATLAQLLIQAPDYGSVGPASSGVVTVAVQPLPGDTITITNQWALPQVSETLTATGGVPAAGEFQIGATLADTAANLATAMAGLSLIGSAAANGAAVTVVTAATGPNSRYQVSASDPASLVWSSGTLEGGDEIVAFYLQAAADQIDAACWGDRLYQGHLWLTLHYLSVATGQTGGEGGVLSSKKIGDIQASYSVAAPSSGGYGSTKWGRMFELAKKTLVVPPVSARRRQPPFPGVC